MKHCGICDSPFDENKVKVPIGINFSVGVDDEQHVLWHVNMTAKCVVYQILDNWYQWYHEAAPKQGDMNGDIDSIDIEWYNDKGEHCTLWEQQGHDGGNDDIPSGYQINDEEFLQWEIPEQAIMKQGLAVTLFMREFEPEDHIDSKAKVLCGKECYWCAKEEREVSTAPQTSIRLSPG